MVEELIYIWIFIISFIFRLQRLVKDLLKHLQGQDSGQWANNKVSSLDRTLGELSRILEKQARQTEHSYMSLFLYYSIIYLIYIYKSLSILLYWCFKNMFSRQTFLLLCVKLKLLNILYKIPMSKIQSVSNSPNDDLDKFLSFMSL